ncbi:MAG: hydantoinase/oxoprolinase family protein, partial [Alphaproteobacteria bacterium]
GREGPSVPERGRPTRPDPVPPPPRRAWCGGAHGWVETPVLRRSDLATARSGPLIVEEYDATCVVPPGARAQLDAGGSIVIDLP